MTTTNTTTRISSIAYVPASIDSGWRLDKIMRMRSRITHVLVKDDVIVALGGRRICLSAERRRAKHNPDLAGGVIRTITPDELRAIVIATARDCLRCAADAEAFTTHLDDHREQIWPGYRRMRIVNGGLDSNGARAAKAALEDRVARIG